MSKMQLQPGETMAQYNRRQRFATDCMDVASLIDRKPGIDSMASIASELGLGIIRVRDCIREINADETPFTRVEYGIQTAKRGPHAGSTVRGWWPMRRAVYHDAMRQANEHSVTIEKGVRRSRTVRLLAAHGFTSQRAGEVVDEILVSLDMDQTKMTASDWDAIFELAMQAPLR
jgi:hypothetical protein